MKPIILFAIICSNTCALAIEDSLINDLCHRLGPMKNHTGYRDDKYWVWGSSIVKGDDGKYHMFVSRWPKTLMMHPGWAVASEIVHCVSEQVEGPYQFSDIALGKRSPEFWDGCSQHNPKIFRYKDQYVLFYMGSTHPFEDAIKNPAAVTVDSPYMTVARSNKRIGIATAKSPYGPWKRLDFPVLNTKPETFYSFLVSNPSPVIHDDGSVTLIFKARKYKNQFPYHSDMVFGVAKAPSITGPYTVIGDKPIIGHNDKLPEMEDPFFWRDSNGYHLLAKDQLGKISGVKGAGLLLNSKDAIHWELDKHPIAYTKKIKNEAGNIIQFGQMERVNGFFENGKLTHLTFAVMDGTGGFSGGKNTWNIVIPIKSEQE